ncbi:unnamed protein product [Symbiodinium necroappetens]|uniref:Uncharacterized protein n=1 Tax=Symbiodinium necroappetens TaxID=1628268 RepID=A0A812IRL6_9DINO|nr:unnamed protein product [Symbiodinium necroappetens]
MEKGRLPKSLAIQLLIVGVVATLAPAGWRLQASVKAAGNRRPRPIAEEEEEEEDTIGNVLCRAAREASNRSGGTGSMSCAAIMGGACGSLLLIPGAPRVEVSGIELVSWKAPFAGAVCGLYLVQLPEGDDLGERCRRVSTWMWRQWLRCQRRIIHSEETWCISACGCCTVTLQVFAHGWP